MALILASESPFRKELLDRLNLKFNCIPAHIDEQKVWPSNTDPNEVAITLSKMKALKVFETNQSDIVIGSDQVITQSGKIFGKPKTIENALNQLKSLQGKPHSLITGVCIKSKDKEVIFSNKTILTIRADLTEENLINYIKQDQPLFCAGSYKIEGKGIALFEKVETTDFTSIIGLPLMQLSKELQKFGLEVL